MNQQKIIQAVAVMGAGFIATKVLDIVWKLVTGNKPPLDDGHDHAPIREIVLFAALSGAFAALARTFASRQAQKYVEKRTDS